MPVFFFNLCFVTIYPLPLLAFLQRCEKRLLASSYLSVCPSLSVLQPQATTRVPLERFSWHLIFEHFFPKICLKIRVQLKSDKNNGYFTLRPTCIHDNISLNSSQNDNCFRQNQNTHFLNLANDHLDAQFLYYIIRLLQSSACFEQRRAHHQEVKMY